MEYELVKKTNTMVRLYYGGTWSFIRNKCNIINTKLFKMKLSIYEIQIPVTSQEQANSLKQICLDNGLPIWESNISFMFTTLDKYFRTEKGKFLITTKRGTEITKTEFINLLKPLKNENRH